MACTCGGVLHPVATKDATSTTAAGNPRSATFQGDEPVVETIIPLLNGRRCTSFEQQERSDRLDYALWSVS